MLIRVRLIGTGTQDDPLRVPYPYYVMIGEPNAQRRVLIDVPDRLAPDEVDAPGTLLRPIIDGKPVLMGLRAAQRQAFRRKMDRLYDRIKDGIDIDVIE